MEKTTKRSRKSVKRERTGCITCKIRRVKCDGMSTEQMKYP
jgi:ferredoxin-like protein FixX